MEKTLTLIKIGSANMPATEVDINDMTTKINAALKNAHPIIVTHHAVTIETVKIDGDCKVIE